MFTLAGVTPDDRYLLRAEAPLSPLGVSALARALEVIERRQPSLDGPERLAHVISVGCAAIISRERSTTHGALAK